MLIDIHCHASDNRGIEKQIGTRRFYPTSEELVAMLDAHGIDRAVLLTAMSPECRTVYVTPFDVARMVAKFPGRLIPFGGLDPRMLTNSPAADFSQMLGFFKDSGFKGIGEYCPNLPFDDPLNMNVYRHVERAGLPLLFHLASTLHAGQYGCYDDPGLPRLERALQAFPGLVFLAHSQVFWAEIGTEVTAENRHGYPSGPVIPGRVPALMRRYPNLHGDLSAGSGHNAIARDPAFGAAFLEEFQDRLYFGTDFALAGQDAPQIALLEAWNRAGRISAAVHEKIAWRNAARLLGLDPGSSAGQADRAAAGAPDTAARCQPAVKGPARQAFGRRVPPAGRRRCGCP